MSLTVSRNTTRGSKSSSNGKNSNKSPRTEAMASKKTPSKSPGVKKMSLTPSPGRKGPRTPNGGDRFIPNRSATCFDFANFKVSKSAEEDDPKVLRHSQREKQRIMTENLMGKESKRRILAFSNKEIASPENSLKVVYMQSKTPKSSKGSTRYIPQVPEYMLDAPYILNDFYLNLIDWSVDNLLAVALESRVYLWNAEIHKVCHLLQLEAQAEYVSSVAWLQEGQHLAVGISNGVTLLYDTSQEKFIRTIPGHSRRVGSLAWNSYVLTTGSQSGHVHQHDVRQPESLVADLNGHSQEVCGLKWSPGGHYLATGGSDQIVNIWPAVGGGQIHSTTTPLYTFSAHQAAVKALAWCPWQPNLLASGGGAADRCIRFWNCNLGSLLNTVDTGSQICSLLWSTTYKEIVSGHGFKNNQIIIWKYPTMNMAAELIGHSERVLHLVMSPDGTTVVSAGADEILRVWKCFQADPDAAKKATSSSSTSTFSVANILKRSIR